MSFPATEGLSQCVCVFSLSLSSHVPSITGVSPPLRSQGWGWGHLSSAIQREATIEVVVDAIQHVNLVDNYAIVINKVPKDADHQEWLQPCQPFCPP